MCRYIAQPGHKKVKNAPDPGGAFLQKMALEADLYASLLRN
jgi:hypothetical protein